MTHFKWVIQDVASQGDVSQNAVRQNGIIAVLSFFCSRCAMRLMNRGISKEAMHNHALWFEQLLTVELSKPLTGYFELGPPDL